MTLTCPECEGSIALAPSPRLSEITNCPDCALELEIISLEPVTIAPAPEIEEDWGE